MVREQKYNFSIIFAKGMGKNRGMGGRYLFLFQKQTSTCTCFQISEFLMIKMKGRLLKIATVWLFLTCLIDSTFSTLSKSDRGKKRQKEQATSGTKVL